MKNYITLFVLAVLVGIGLILVKSEPVARGEVNFSELGVVIDKEPDKFNEGITLVYEKPGAPALTADLTFNEQSKCVFGGHEIQCMALSVTIEGPTVGKQVFVEGVREGTTVLVHTLAIDKEAGRKFGYIKSLKRNGQNYLVEVDEIEMLSGDKALEAAAADTPCGKADASDCVPSLNNDFYIRNLDKKTEVYNITADTKIQIFKNPGSPVLEEVDAATFATRYKDAAQMMTSYPFMYLLDGATVTDLVEQYLP